MDIIEYQKSRDKELQEFQESYGQLKARYSTLLSDAIYEQDPQKQAELVNSVLQVNSELASEVRAFISKAGDDSGYDPKTLDNLTADLLKFQQEYEEVRKSNDMVKTLDMILNQQKHKFEQITSQFNWLLGLLILAIVVVIFLIFRTSTSIFTKAGQAVSQTLQGSQG